MKSRHDVLKSGPPTAPSLSRPYFDLSSGRRRLGRSRLVVESCGLDFKIVHKST